MSLQELQALLLQLQFRPDRKASSQRLAKGAADTSKIDGNTQNGLP